MPDIKWSCITKITSGNTGITHVYVNGRFTESILPPPIEDEAAEIARRLKGLPLHEDVTTKYWVKGSDDGQK